MNRDIISSIEQALSRHFEEPVSVAQTRTTGGGSINVAAVLETDHGEFFAKSNDRPIVDQFECEAAGLVALAEAQSALAIPKPIVWRDWAPGASGFLVMEFFSPGKKVDDFDETLGRELAALHRNTSTAFGFHSDNYCGATAQPNPWTSEWTEFYRSHRLEHQLELGSYDSSDRRDLVRLLDRLDELLDIEPEPPSLIHGDLWSGNLHATPQGWPALVDPAAYYGHREAELGMMKLFGGFAQGVWDAYDRAYPLQHGWQDRLPLYELYHVMNHNTLFGGGYARQAVSIARRYL